MTASTRFGSEDSRRRRRVGFQAQKESLRAAGVLGVVEPLLAVDVHQVHDRRYAGQARYVQILDHAGAEYEHRVKRRSVAQREIVLRSFVERNRPSVAVRPDASDAAARSQREGPS